MLEYRYGTLSRQRTHRAYLFSLFRRSFRNTFVKELCLFLKYSVFQCCKTALKYKYVHCVFWSSNYKSHSRINRIWYTMVSYNYYYINNNLHLQYILLLSEDVIFKCSKTFWHSEEDFLQYILLSKMIDRERWDALIQRLHMV